MYLSRTETQFIKLVIWRVWEGVCAFVLLLALLCGLQLYFKWQVLTIAPAVHGFAYGSLSFVIAWCCYRLYRRHPKRCPACRKKGIVHGWFFENQYYRIRRPDQGGADECHFPNFCRECGEEYEVKPPMVKSFSHRPLWIRNW